MRHPMRVFALITEPLPLLWNHGYDDDSDVEDDDDDDDEYDANI